MTRLCLDMGPAVACGKAVDVVVRTSFASSCARGLALRSSWADTTTEKTTNCDEQAVGRGRRTQTRNGQGEGKSVVVTDQADR